MSHLLSILILLPVLASLGMLLIPADRKPVIKTWALGASLLNLALGLGLWFGFQPEVGFQFAEKADWLPSLGISYHVGVDGLSILIAMLTLALTPVAILASWNRIDTKLRGYYASLLLLSSGMLGAVVARDLFLFYVFWEVMLLPMFFLIGIWGGEKRVYATVKFVVYTLIGSLFMFLAILYVYFKHHALNGTWTFDIPSLYALSYSPTEMWLLFGAFFLAFAIKTPVWPFHSWLPDAYTQAPTPATFMLSAVMAKIGAYGFLRFLIPMFPEATKTAAPFIMILAMFGLIFGAWIALVQTDAKRLIAYSSLSHMSIIVLGIFALNVYGVTGSVFYFMAHALATGALFLMVMMLAERRGTREIAQFGGIAKAAPWLTVAFIFVTMASVGLPGLNGFIGEFMMLLGTYGASNAIGVIATTGVIWSACYMLWMVSRIFFGEITRPENQGFKDLSLREIAVILPLAAVILWTGFYPQTVLSKVEPSVQAFLQQTGFAAAQEAKAPAHTPAAAAHETEGTTPAAHDGH
jgi:NADH-quinone oxidoreductase subunit M